MNVLLSGAKNVEESNVVDTEAELATLNLNEAAKPSAKGEAGKSSPKSEPANSSPKGEAGAKSSAKTDAVSDDSNEYGNTNEQQATATTTATNEGGTRVTSQIEARLAQVRTLQDRMMQGESYLDKIGQPDPKMHPRFNPFVIFGGGDISWEASKETPAPVKSHRPKSAIRGFTVPLATVPLATVSLPTEQPTNTEDDTSCPLSRPQTVLLRRPNPNLSDVPQIE
jgi:hypothetical protein